MSQVVIHETFYDPETGRLYVSYTKRYTDFSAEDRHAELNRLLPAYSKEILAQVVQRLGFPGDLKDLLKQQMCTYIRSSATRKD